MIVAVGLGAVSVLLSHFVWLIASRCGPDVAARFLERGWTIPSTNGKLSRYSPEGWRRSPGTNDVQAKMYAWFVMPGDILYVLCLGGFLFLATISFQQIVFHDSIWAYTIWLLPICYALADLVEDFLIIYLLLCPQPVKKALFYVMRGSTWAKIVAGSLALIQLALLAGYATWSHPYWADCSFAGLVPRCFF
jgi:hypothetical protein